MKVDGRGYPFLDIVINSRNNFPPSRGGKGIRLKIPSEKLINATNSAIDCNPCLDD